MSQGDLGEALRNLGDMWEALCCLTMHFVLQVLCASTEQVLFTLCTSTLCPSLVVALIVIAPRRIFFVCKLFR